MPTNERIALIEQVTETLERGNFEISERCDIRPSCFDLFARKDLVILIVKVLSNIDSMDEIHAMNMRYLSSALYASPLLIGYKTREGQMEEGLVYERHGVLAISPDTLEDIILHKVLPVVLSARGGCYVKIDGKRLREIREEKDISLGEVAENIGVTRRTVNKYEQGFIGATLNTALRLEEYLDEALIVPIDILVIPKEIKLKEKIKVEEEMPMLHRLVEIGFNVHPVEKAPFDALTRGEEKVLITKIAKLGLEKVARRAVILNSISDITDTDAFFIVESGGFKSNLGGVPAVKSEELEKIEEPAELVETLYSRRG